MFFFKKKIHVEQLNQKKKSKKYQLALTFQTHNLSH